VTDLSNQSWYTLGDSGSYLICLSSNIRMLTFVQVTYKINPSLTAKVITNNKLLAINMLVREIIEIHYAYRVKYKQGTKG